MNDTPDIVTRLRHEALTAGNGTDDYRWRAANIIERLRSSVGGEGEAGRASPQVTQPVPCV